MRRHGQGRLLAAGAALAALAAAGCGGGSAETVATAPPAETAAPIAETETIEPATECDELADAIAAQVGSDGALDMGSMDTLGLAAPHQCASLAELTATLAEHDLQGLDEFVTRTCVAGDAWVTIGEPSQIADTELCREARSRYTLDADENLVEAEATYSEDFAGGCNGWASKGSADVRFSCEKGAYRVVVLQAGKPARTAFRGDRRHEALSVEADATLVRPDTGGLELHGVMCSASEQLGYAFILSPAGEYVIVKEDRTADEPVFLEHGEAPRAVPGAGSFNRIRGECAAGPAGVRLALFVNGRQVAVARDKAEVESFRDFGLYVATSEPRTEVRFDNVLVRDLGGS